MKPILYYVSKNHDRLNAKDFQPELVNDRICLNPKYGATLGRPEQVKVLLDSGAFQDRQKHERLTFQAALNRQTAYEEDRRFTSELIVSYDRLVDETAEAKGRTKKRVSYRTAEKYVQETVDAGKFLADQRRNLRPRRLVLSCQGTTAPMYLDCVKEILSFSEKEDVIGFGGFCIVGQRPSLKGQLFTVLEQTIPRLKRKGIKRLHFFGVGYFPVLVRANVMCRRAGIEPSYDTSSYEFNGVVGRVFDPIRPGISQVFMKPDKRALYHPADLAALNIRLVTNFWDEVNAMNILRAKKARTSPERRKA